MVGEVDIDVADAFGSVDDEVGRVAARRRSEGAMERAPLKGLPGWVWEDRGGMGRSGRCLHVERRGKGGGH